MFKALGIRFLLAWLLFFLPWLAVAGTQYTWVPVYELRTLQVALEKATKEGWKVKSMTNFARCPGPTRSNQVECLVLLMEKDS